MNDATHGAENIRNDITALSQRYAVVKRDETCKVSNQYIYMSLGILKSFWLSFATLPSQLIQNLRVYELCLSLPCCKFIPPTNFKNESPTSVCRFVDNEYWRQKGPKEQQGQPEVIHLLWLHFMYFHASTPFTPSALLTMYFNIQTQARYLSNYIYNFFSHVFETDLSRNQVALNLSCVLDTVLFYFNISC